MTINISLASESLNVELQVLFFRAGPGMMEQVPLNWVCFMVTLSHTAKFNNLFWQRFVFRGSVGLMGLGYVHTVI